MNTRIFVLVQFLLASSALFAQGTANFSYTVTNNHVTITELATCNCQYYWVSYNYGDTASGALNTDYHNPILSHYYRDPGTYTICAYLNNSGTGGCTCSDTFCQTVTITTQGTDCHAEYCYEMYLDTATNSNWVQYYNTSTADDSITESVWHIEGALALSWDMGKYYNILDVPYPAFLMIHTQTGCESGFVVDTVFWGNTCDTLTSYQSILSSHQVKVYPNPAQDRLTIEMSEGKPPFACVFYNMLGQKVYEQQLTQSATQVFVGNWAKGAYFYEVITLKEKIYGKVFIE